VKRPAFTPGPWSISGLDPNVIGPVRILVMDGAEVPQQQAVARVIDRTNESVANARLISAAPKLYDGCNALIGLIQLVCLRGDMPPQIKQALICSHRMDEALDAIRTAEGRP
jgi:hypothetical protein